MANVILIPVYKSSMSSEESFSLMACFEVLGNHEIVFVAPVGLDLTEYYSFCRNSVRVERFDDSYFKSISGYNKLLLSTEFYNRFLDYDYMLIYQLDCYVFKDELDYWAGLGYDYIGAPWLLNGLDSMGFFRSFLFKIKRVITFYKGYFDKTQISYRVGNGGFSLRNTRVFYQHLKKPNKKKFLRFISNDSNSLFNEDVYWSLFSGIKKPDYKLGCRFSLESFPEVGMKFNNGELPFGCHAWKKEFGFWSKYIAIQGG